MHSRFRFAETEQSFNELCRSVDLGVDLRARLPDWPFRAEEGFATIFEYHVVIDESFGAVLEGLVSAYGDQFVTSVGILPTMSYYRDEYGFFPAFQVAGAEVGLGYGGAMRWRPSGDLTGALVHSLDIVAISGSSGHWAVQAQRDWEIGLLLTRDSQGPWLTSGEPWFDLEIELGTIRSPTGWCMPLSTDELSAFWQNVRGRGSGPAGGVG